MGHIQHPTKALSMSLPSVYYAPLMKLNIIIIIIIIIISILYTKFNKMLKNLLNNPVYL